eukprot:3625485-Amphidinium_carterae.2
MIGRQRLQMWVIVMQDLLERARCKACQDFETQCMCEHLIPSARDAMPMKRTQLHPPTLKRTTSLERVDYVKVPYHFKERRTLSGVWFRTRLWVFNLSGRTFFAFCARSIMANKSEKVR